MRTEKARAGDERCVQDDRGDAVPCGQAHRRHAADALTVEDHVCRVHVVARRQRQPRRLDVGVEVLLRRPTAADAEPRIVVAARRDDSRLCSWCSTHIMSTSGLYRCRCGHRFYIAIHQVSLLSHAACAIAIAGFGSSW